MNAVRLHIIWAAIFAVTGTSLADANSVSTATLTPNDLDTLNSTVHGRLFASVPFARSCFQNANSTGGSFQSSECSVVEDNYTNGTFRRNVFGSYMNTEWETCQATSQQCLLDSSDPANPLAFSSPQVCNPGAIPSYYIDVENTNVVIAGFNFANTTGVNLVIKNTGHDYKGRSSGPNSLALFMHNLDSIMLNNSFTPSGCGNCKPQPAVTMGAGTTFVSLYAFADANNITVPGGSDPTVGPAGGYVTGGGHSILSNAYGLFVDRLLEAEVVVPTGEILIANEQQNTDLFFAIRGGGGGTFGVVMSITTIALPRMTLPTFSITTDALATDVTNQEKWLTFMTSKVVALSQTGWGGYISPKSGLIYTNPLINDSEATAQFQDIMDFAVSEFNATVVHTVETSYLAFYDAYIVPTVVPVGSPFATASRLIPLSNLATNDSQAELVDAIMPAVTAVALPIIFQVGPLFYGANGTNISGTSITPAWRDSIWHLTTATSWNFNTTFEERREIYSNLTTNMNIVRNITSGSGAYLNEADVYEPNFQETYWGSNYNTLLEIKNKYDPLHILDCWQCVGFEGASSPQYDCYLSE